MNAQRTLVVDAANVVGSVPDGWWKDRKGAAERLRDSLARYGSEGLPGWPAPLDVVLVVEGAARGVTAIEGVRVVAASGSGDDRIVAEVERTPGPTLVITADRELRDRVTALGA
ncbi:NYN domain-containing protein, partial [Streptomyces sp. SID11233]|nr:NYN domain-containing protein [Streptomyces sp. SID11233]